MCEPTCFCWCLCPKEHTPYSFCLSGSECNIAVAPPKLPPPLTCSSIKLEAINDASGVRTIDVVLIYDPALLTVTDVAVGPGMPIDATAQINWYRDRGQVRWVSMTFRTSTAAIPP